MFIQRVVGNVKGGADVTLGRLTLVTGNNGAGKSTIVNIMELALMGFASDIVGRPEVRKGSDLISLAPKDQPLLAEAYTDENDRAHFTIERGKEGKTKDPLHVGLSGVQVLWPIREAVTALRGQVASARSFVLRHGGLVVTEKMILQEFGNDQEVVALYSSLAAAARAQSKEKNPDEIEVLLGVQVLAKDAAKSARARAKEAKEIIDKSSADLTVDPTEEEEKAQTEEVHRLIKEIARVELGAAPGPSPEPGAAPPVLFSAPPVQAPAPVPIVFYDLAPLERRGIELQQRKQEVGAQLNALLAQYQELGARIEAKTAEGEPKRSVSAEQSRILTLLDGVYAYHQSQPGLTQCTVCWQPWQIALADLTVRRENLKAAVESFQREEAAIRLYKKTMQAEALQFAQLIVEGQRVQAEYAALEAEFAQAYSEWTEQAAHNQRQSVVLAEMGAVHNAFVEPEPAPVPAPVPTLSGGGSASGGGLGVDHAKLAELQEQLQKAQKTLTQTMHTRAAWAQVRLAQRREATAKKEAAAATAMADQAVTIADNLLARGKAGFVKKVQAFLPPTDIFDVVLKEGTKSVCHFGFRRGLDLHTALSGAEWARLTIALGAATIPQDNSRVLAILTPEERAFDPHTLGEVMEALKNSPGQVILTSPVVPPTPVSGWVHLTR